MIVLDVLKRYVTIVYKENNEFQLKEWEEREMQRAMEFRNTRVVRQNLLRVRNRVPLAFSSTLKR